MCIVCAKWWVKFANVSVENWVRLRSRSRYETLQLLQASIIAWKLSHSQTCRLTDRNQKVSWASPLRISVFQRCQRKSRASKEDTVCDWQPQHQLVSSHFAFFANFSFKFRWFLVVSGVILFFAAFSGSPGQVYWADLWYTASGALRKGEKK